MDEAFSLEAMSQVQPGTRATLVGRIEAKAPDSLTLNDTTGSIKVTNVPTNLTGFLEVRGHCRTKGCFEAVGFTAIREEIDLGDHLKLVDLYKRVHLLG